MATSRERGVEQRACIKALFDAGLSYWAIASDLTCSPSTVKYNLDITTGPIHAKTVEERA